MAFNVDVFGKCAATGVGSVPFTDTAETIRTAVDGCPEIPYLPQQPKNSFLEDMCPQVLEGFPGVQVDKENHRVWVDTSCDCGNDIMALIESYESGQIDGFGISRERASGFFAVLDYLETSSPGRLPVLKGQLVGPATLGQGLLDQDGTAIIHNPVFGELVSQLLVVKARWLVQQMRNVADSVVLVYDEPSLSALGSAYFSLDHGKVESLLDAVIEPLARDGVAVGVHCCGNSDWSVFLDRTDVVSFDAFSYFEKMSVYSDAINRFYDRGGVLAWGIVPTLELTDDITEDMLVDKLDSNMNSLAQTGIDLDVVRSRAVVTPACGMGSLSIEKARRVAELTAGVAHRCKAMYFS